MLRKIRLTLILILILIVITCKGADVSEPHFGGPASKPHRRKPTHLYHTFSHHGYVPSTPMLDGHLLAHPLVLDVDEQPATLRASTLMSRPTKPSVMHPNERCPPAAIPRSSTGVRSGRATGSAAAPVAPPSRTPRIHEPSHSRRLPLNSISAHVGYHVVQGFASLRKQIADANGDSPGQRGYWKVVRGGPTPIRHTRGTHWHLRARHARAETRSCTDTLTHGHARAITRISHDARLLPAAGLRPPR